MAARLVLLGLSAVLAACGGSQPTPAPKAVVAPPPAKDLATAGTLTVGTDVNSPPQEFRSGSGDPQGFDIDLGRELASHMGLRVAYVDQQFDGLFAGLNAHHFDVVISAMPVSPANQAKLALVPYLRAGEGLLVKKGSPFQPAKLEDLCGHKVAIIDGSAELDTATQLNKGLCAPKNITAVSAKTDGEALGILRKATAEAIFTDSAIAAYEAKTNKDATLSGGILQPVVEGMGYRSNDKPMGDAITAALQKMQQDGSYAKLLAKWGLQAGDITKG